MVYYIWRPVAASAKSAIGGNYRLTVEEGFSTRRLEGVNINMITKFMPRASIWILHLFIAVDYGFMGVVQQWRRRWHDPLPYLNYSFLRFLILGMLLTLHVKYARLNRKLWNAFLLLDGILLVCFWRGYLLYPWEILLTVMGVLLAQLWETRRQLGQGRETIDI